MSMCYFDNVMKTLKLLLPDHTYQIASNLAMFEDVEIGQFAAGILSEALTSYQARASKTPDSKSTDAASINWGLSKTLEQIYQVCVQIWVYQCEIPEAIKVVAEKFDVDETTIRDKCTRRINLPSFASFKELVLQPDAFVHHLCERFPADADEIRRNFGNEKKMNCPTEKQVVPMAQKPAAKEIHELDLITAIVTILKRNGGKMNKPEVEKAVFDQYADVFRHEWYQTPVGGGVPRWLKNVQFARNTACNILQFLKSPDEAGRGVWELTEEGKKMADTFIKQATGAIVRSIPRTSPPNRQN